MGHLGRPIHLRVPILSLYPAMKRILHILTQPAKPAVEQLILDQRQLPDQEVLIISLNQESPDYPLLLEKVFQSDSIQCW